MLHNNRRPIDMVLLAPVIALVLWSLFHFYSLFGYSSLYYLQRQAIWVAVGLGLLFIFSYLPATLWPRLSPIVYVIAIALLGIVIAKGTIIYGAQRWLEVGFLGFRGQPSELAKLALIMLLARLLSERESIRWWLVLLSLAFTLLLAGMIAIQPDLGTASIVAVVGVVMLFVSGIGARKIATLAAAFAGLIPAIYFLLRPYQRMRIFTFLEPGKDPLGAGWSTLQSKIALGSGGLVGRGLGGAIHTRLRYLPQPYTDFIFASMGEEWGFIGTTLIVMALTVIAVRGILLALRSGNNFAGLFAVGFITLIALQSFVNMAMASGIIPVTGVPLPFLSYGGSSILLFLSGMGILLSLAREKEH